MMSKVTKPAASAAHVPPPPARGPPAADAAAQAAPAAPPPPPASVIPPAELALLRERLREFYEERDPKKVENPADFEKIMQAAQRNGLEWLSQGLTRKYGVTVDLSPCSRPPPRPRPRPRPRRTRPRPRASRRRSSSSSSNSTSWACPDRAGSST
jgi:hypothetical protein